MASLKPGCWGLGRQETALHLPQPGSVPSASWERGEGNLPGTPEEWKALWWHSVGGHQTPPTFTTAVLRWRHSDQQHRRPWEAREGWKFSASRTYWTRDQERGPPPACRYTPGGSGAHSSVRARAPIQPLCLWLHVHRNHRGAQDTQCSGPPGELHFPRAIPSVLP